MFSHSIILLWVVMIAPMAAIIPAVFLQEGGRFCKLNKKLADRFRFLAVIRKFFLERDFIDVLTPPLVSCPVIEPHIHPFRVSSSQRLDQGSDFYLHTSPEFWMKSLLSEGFENIFTLSYCFRDGPPSPIHRPQFLMLEWYRAHESYHQIACDLEELTRALLGSFGRNDLIAVEKMSVAEIFRCHLGIDILELSCKESLGDYIKNHHPDIPLPKIALSWEDYYHLLFLNKISPLLRRYPFLILDEYPAELRALSRLKPCDPRVCERFEYFVHGVEVANCYGELTHLEEQKKCFQEFDKVRTQVGQERMPEPALLYRALEKGIPPSAGIALGVERFMGVLLDREEIFLTEESS
ncbi:MAG: hypothetical protein OXB88_00730 [Bacteriovoracales bacterium]|nr:hypothetical protein [Bacteriovoracales bacterium]